MNSAIIRKACIAVTALITVPLAWWGIARLLENPVEQITAASSHSDSSRKHDSKPAGQESASSPKRQFVGSKACAECHPEISKQYQANPMARSAHVVQASGTIEDASEETTFKVPRAPGFPFQTVYEVIRNDQAVTHRRMTVDLDGNLICERSVPVHFAVGSGTRGFSYFSNMNGKLFMSPVTWYTGANRWDSSPGYVTNDMHFERRIVDGCVACHIGQSAPHPELRDVFEPEPFVELGLSCERCHGPGSEHVRFHQTPTDNTSAIDPIVNPEKLSQPFRDDVCFQCHLIGEERVIHNGKRDFDFVAGQAMSDVWTVFLHGTKIAGRRTTKAVGQVEQMLSSRCYQMSAGQMSCSSCHASHTVPEDADKAAFYRSRCISCHDGQDNSECGMALNERIKQSQNDDCTQCHMPSLPTVDVPHTSQTDHRVLRHAGERPPRQASLENLNVYEADRLGQSVIDRAHGIFLVQKTEDTGNKSLAYQAIDLLQTVVNKDPTDVQAMEALGRAYEATYNLGDAELILKKVLDIQPESEDALRTLMLLNHDNGSLDAGIEYGRRLVELNPAHNEYHGRLAHMLAQKGLFKEALESGLAAVELQPWSYQMHGWIAEVAAHVGREDLVGKHRQLFEQLKPIPIRDAP